MKISNTKWMMVLAGIAIVSLFAITLAKSAQKSFAGAAKPADTPDRLEAKIWSLLEDSKSVYVTLPEEDFRALGAGFDLPDGGKTVTELATKAPGGAFDPRDLSKVAPEKLGYKADWIVERYKRYNLDWDITGLRLTSLNQDAKRYPWLIIMNGGAANVYEFYVDLKNRPGWGQYLAQKINVMIITIPGNFKYGGWEEPIQSPKRQPAYLLDRDLSIEESEVRNCLLTNAVVLQGVKALIMKHTEGDILMIGHSTSGEISMLANEDPDLRARLKGRYLGWGSGGPARLDNIREAKEGRGRTAAAATAAPRKPIPLQVLERRDPLRYSQGYSGFLNPLYEPGMSFLQIAEKWLDAEGRRRANFKQQIQNLEHGGEIGEKGRIEVEIENLLKKAGNPWGVNLEDVSKDLFITHFTRMDGFKQMVWTVAHFDRNHWVPEDPMKAVEVFVAKEYRSKNPDAKIRLIVWDPPMTHYGHLELPKQLAAAEYSVIRWFFQQGEGR
jgi:hypothetical protein